MAGKRKAGQSSKEPDDNGPSTSQQATKKRGKTSAPNPDPSSQGNASKVNGHVSKKQLTKSEGETNSRYFGQSSRKEKQDENIPVTLSFANKLCKNKIKSVKSEINTADCSKSHISNNNPNFVQYLNRLLIGQKCTISLKKARQSPIKRHLSELRVYDTLSPFDRRCTSLAWHPNQPSTIAVGSKGGDIILWKFGSSRQTSFIPGIGPGGSILAMKFHEEHPTFLYTASLDGKVSLVDFSGKQNQIFLDTMIFDQWYCSLDVSHHKKILIAGDTIGNVTLLSTQGDKAWSLRLHKSKVTHAEFSPKEEWLLVTASLDGTMKLWDIRNVKNRDSSLIVCPHNESLNSAYFSLKDGCRILTTDQRNELRVYQGPFWNLERIIPHPHRQFQYLTPIKAHWHPLEDIIVVGRYPDEKFSGYVPGERRSVDFFSADTGELIHQLIEQGVVGILSLNQFNFTADTLASCMGSNILLWKQKDEVENYKRLNLRGLSKYPSRLPGRTPRAYSNSQIQHNRDTEPDSKGKRRGWRIMMTR